MEPLPDPVPYRATAVRPGWRDLPADVRAGVETALGAAVVDAVSAGGGFTGGFASVLRAADGRRWFVKAADGAGMPVIAAAYRREARINAALPTGVPAPRVRWAGEVAGWAVVAADAVDGRMPALPWRAAELDAALTALARCADALAVAPDGLDLAPVTVELAHDFSAWRRVAGGVTTLDGLDGFVVAHLDELAALEAGWTAAAGTAVVHGDLRPDNIVIGTDGRAWVCDWNWPVLGAPWIDLVCLLPTVHASGLDASAVLAAHPAGRNADPAAVDGVLAGLAGFFAEAGRNPPFPGASPWVNVHRRWYGAATVSWLAARRGWRFLGTTRRGW